MTKNVTVAIPASAHRKARMWAASHNTSLSAIVTHLLGNLDALVKIRRQYDGDHPAQPESQE
jgi:hypothetical protein